LGSLTAPVDSNRRKQVRPPRVVLTSDQSAALREKLMTELKPFSESDALTIWAQRILALKNQLTTSDAQEVETAFATKLNQLCNENIVHRKPARERRQRALANQRAKPLTSVSYSHAN
jgi:hypothetical protein